MKPSAPTLKDENQTKEEYIRSLESKILIMTKKYKQDIDKVLDMISEKNKKLKSSFDLSFIRQYFSPTIIPSLICGRFGVSKRELVLMAEKNNLFEYPELAIRVPRINEAKVVKSSTTVLFSLMGFFILCDMVARVIDERVNNLPKEKLDDDDEEFLLEDMEEAGLKHFITK